MCDIGVKNAGDDTVILLDCEELAPDNREPWDGDSYFVEGFSERSDASTTSVSKGLALTSSSPGNDETSSNRERKATRSAVPGREVTPSVLGGPTPLMSFPAIDVTAPAVNEGREVTTGAQPQKGNGWNSAQVQRGHQAAGQQMIYTSQDRIHMREVTSSPPYAVVEQPIPTHRTGVEMSPGEPPAEAYVVLITIASFLSIFCCLCTGVAAFVVSIQASIKKQEGNYKEARQKLIFACALIIASIFFFAPIIVMYITSHEDISFRV